jgi:hypothetical protein
MTSDLHEDNLINELGTAERNLFAARGFRLVIGAGSCEINPAVS